MVREELSRVQGVLMISGSGMGRRPDCGCGVGVRPPLSGGVAAYRRRYGRRREVWRPVMAGSKLLRRSERAKGRGMAGVRRHKWGETFGTCGNEGDVRWPRGIGVGGDMRVAGRVDIGVIALLPFRDAPVGVHDLASSPEPTAARQTASRAIPGRAR